ncbi:NACHT domain- and WD repeat-containing protein 1 [Planococcus citri]|uniref:NACHT domain- and WD repeat-containing protein 1 n=1 Tax=Planococcus citri TaxID=170843 RepID=UPI0031F8C853
MGNTCSTRHRDKDNASLHSEEYQLSNKRKSSSDSKTGDRRPSVKSNLQSGVILKVSTASAPGSEDDHRRDSATIIQQQQQQQQQRKNGSICVSSHKDMACGKPLKPVISSQATTPDRNLYLPEDINELSDTHKQLLLGVVPVSKPILKAKKIVIYVCAADPEECHVEKTVLHGSVYPELRKICRQEGYELHMADLHWKTLLEKRRDHKFPELCIFELNRQSETSYIVPVIFLSNSWGTSLLPKTIECEDFENTLQRTNNKELLKKWYKLDKECQPTCYRLQSIEQHIPGFKEDNSAEVEKALKEWNNEVENMLLTLVSSFNQELRDTYFSTTVEQEIHNTMRMSQELTKHSIWLHRINNKQDSDDNESCPIRQENKRRLNLLLNELKNELSEKNIIKLTDATNEDQIKTLILPQFTSIMRSIIDDDRLKAGSKASYFGVDRSLLRELMIQTIFCQKAAAAHSISNYHNIVNILKNYVLAEDERGLMVIHGLSGCGKTTVLARLLLNCQTLLPNLAVIFRFVNISTESSSLELLLHSILSQIHYVITGRQFWEPHSISKYVELFPKLLSLASENRPVLIVIDGLDQLRGPADNIDWIPVLLPRNIKFIISVTENTTAITNVQNKLQDTAVFVQIPELRDNESETILYTLIAESDDLSCAQLPEKIRSAVKESSLPFYIKIIANQYSWLKSDSLKIYSKTEMDVQVNQMLDALEKILGKARVELALALLVAARFGLTDSEMLDILCFEDLFHNDSYQVVWAPACIFWSEFNKYMRSFLRWFHTTDNITLALQHELMRETVEKRYKYKINQARQLLHTYFTGSLWDSSEKLKIGARVLSQPMKYKNFYNTRKFEELPFHEYKLFNTLQKHFLEDHTWLYSKVCACSVYQALEDVKLEKLSRKEADVNLILIQMFLEEYAPALHYDGRQFYSQLLKFLNDYKRKFLSNTSPFYNTIKTVIKKPPIYSLLSYSDCLEDPNPADNSEPLESIEKPKNIKGYQFDVIKRIEFLPDFIVTVSTDMQEISVWDVTNCQLVRKLKNVPQPMALEMIDQFRCVVLCNRELRIYDLNTGELVSKLKGVMNQKMPYFGLHDSSHLVALSRNRMYVNLMNLESGDLVTSFKAGEDRFLNSLLVSGNGKILVCGDETQKPFPLLVWNLASRKLLYDLRIAHHDFLTKLAAITYEGNFVCCVAKEVDEPSPNFIVVYDLQSGTLFKKWKPGVNCVSLDISSKDSCVLSGHQNGAISIWDLITGACKWMLEGHTAPVTHLRLDAVGGAFLSTDSSGRDKSIRLWNLTNGELTAIFTPSKTITASEILSGGKYVVIAMEGSSKLSILHLTGPTTEQFLCFDEPTLSAPSREYGIEQNYGKVFDLNYPAADR